jgi:hypothetical protein
MSHFKFSSPLIRGFSHADYTAGLTAAVLLDASIQPERRVMVIIQNKSTTVNIQVMLSSIGAAGIIIPPLGSITIENYSGHVRVSASAASTPVHIAYAVV